MAIETKIAWCDSTWNPWIGCDSVSAGCLNCYARRWARRAGRPFDGPRRAADPSFYAPLAWSTPGGRRRRRLVFVCSLSDFFHPRADPFRPDAWRVIRETPRHIYILLTKRPELIADRLPNGWPWPHVGLGVTAEDQRAARERVPILCGLEAAFRMVSAEPLIGQVDLSYRGLCMTSPTVPSRVVDGIDWIVGAGETADPPDAARPTHVAWAQLLRDQAEATGVPFCWKGWGEWTPYAAVAFGDPHRPAPKSMLIGMNGEVLEGHAGNIKPDATTSTQGAVYLVGRKRTGRELAGRTWDQRPEICHEDRPVP